MKEERLYVVGYMASGKTTFARALAERTGWRFVDLDEEVERLAGVSIPQLMASEGEEAFRRLESRALKSTASQSRVVVACGGGTPCYRDNMEFITLHGMSLWLIATPERIAERIRIAGKSRPLVAGVPDEKLPEFVAGHLRKRQPYYCRAAWRLSGEELESEKQIDDTIDKFLGLYPFECLQNGKNNS